MRIGLFLLLLTIFHLNAENTYSQVTSLSLSLKNTTIERVLDRIEEETEFNFLILDKSLDIKKITDIQSNNENIEEVLNRLFKETNIQYRIIDRQIILTQKTSSVPGIAQQSTRRLRGTVTDESGEPIIGANVMEKGTTNGIITDMDGGFSLEVADNAVLRISYIGYLPREIAVKNQSLFTIVLSEDAQAIDEVVVVGYGTQKKVTLTGAVSSIGTDEIVKAPVSNISNALVGRLPGIRVQNSGGVPGAESTVDIRGFGKPLILVDGIEQPGFQIDPNEIESISVLKDASAAIYGVKAGNGVLLITTKKGTKSEPRITYNGSVGFQNLTSYPDVVNAAQYAELVDEDALNRGNEPIYGPEKLALFKEGKEDGYKSYNWKDIMIRSSAPQTQHNINVNGGSEKVQYFASVGYLDQQGLYSTKDLKFRRYNFRSNVTAKIAEYLTAEVHLGGHIENKNSPFDEDTYITHSITRMHPTFSPYANDDNQDYYGLTNFQNPLARADADVSGYKKEKKKLFNGSFSVKYDMPFIPGLSAKVLFSYLTKIEELKNFAKEFHLYSYDKKNNTYGTVFTGNSPSNLWRKDYTSEQNLLQFSLNYQRTFLEKHNITALLLYEQREDLSDYVEAYRQFDIDALDQINAGTDKNKNNAGMESEMANVSFVGRINYDYMGKYMLEFAFREDGSAKFHKDNRWGFFPSVSTGWRISEESFVKDHISFLDNLKLRASYGVMGDDRALDRDGNETIRAFQFMTGYKFPGDYNYIFGNDVVKSVDVRGLPNYDYTWLKSEIFNFGIDVSLWNRLLEVNMDVFYRKRKGLVATRSLSLPNTFGSELPQENLNSDDYRGFELVLGHTNKVSDFLYSVKGNLSFTRIKNKYIEQADPINSYAAWKNNRNNRWQNIEYGYRCVGQFKNQEEINNWAVQDGTGNTTLMPGDLKFQDFNGDGIIDAYDVQPIRRNNVPDIYFGLDFTAAWKGFDFSLLMQGATNYSIRMEGAMGYPLFNGSTSLSSFLDRWRRADLYDPDSEWIPGKYPSTYISGKESNKRISTFNTINAYYLRVKNLELGYTFPKHLISKVGINNLRLYLSGNNLLTFDNLPFGDPEAPSGDRILYPQIRVMNIGVNITF